MFGPERAARGVQEGDAGEEGKGRCKLHLDVRDQIWRRQELIHFYKRGFIMEYGVISTDH